MSNIEQQIQALLDKVEAEHDVKIILAVESGSRAWGFPSQDSDYDIRFIYRHNSDWYASVFPKRDVIENMFVGDLDAGGWDLRKALQLMHKGNAPLHEWLHSPIVYRVDETRKDLLVELANRSVNPKALYYHYMSLAKKKVLGDDFTSNPKAFLYGFRALLCAKWLTENTTAPPVLFQQLLDKYLEEPITNSLRALLEAKLNQGEKDISSISDDLVGFAQVLFEELKLADVEAIDFPPPSEFEDIFSRSLGL